MITQHNNKIVTVRGLIEPDELKISMCHEHISVNFLDYFVKPTQKEVDGCCVGSNDGKTAEELSNEKLSLSNLYWIQYNYNKNKDNMVMDEMDVAVNELLLFKKNGGSTIVELTSIGIGRNVTFCKELSEKTNVNIVLGAGYYIDKTIRDKGDDKKTIEEMENELIKQLTIGINGTNIRAGIIGEVGCSYPLTELEKKSLIASARASKKTGAAITIHPGRGKNSPSEILSLLIDNQVDLSRVVIGHIDRTIHDDLDTLLALVETGCILEFDLFGMEISNYPFNSGDIIGMPNDNQRIEWIYRLIQKGYSKQILISHDIYSKHRLVTYGGHGYSHILHNIVPRMLKYGYTQDNIDDLLVNNAKRLLTIKQSN